MTHARAHASSGRGDGARRPFGVLQYRDTTRECDVSSAVRRPRRFRETKEPRLTDRKRSLGRHAMRRRRIRSRVRSTGRRSSNAGGPHTVCVCVVICVLCDSRCVRPPNHPKRVGGVRCNTTIVQITLTHTYTHTNKLFVATSEQVRLPA